MLKHNLRGLVLLRNASPCVLGLLFAELLFVDLNGRLFGLAEGPSRVLAGGTFFAGVTLVCVLSVLDAGWRLVHLGFLAIYLAILWPLLVG